MVSNPPQSMETQTQSGTQAETNGWAYVPDQRTPGYRLSSHLQAHAECARVGSCHSREMSNLNTQNTVKAQRDSLDSATHPQSKLPLAQNIQITNDHLRTRLISCDRRERCQHLPRAPVGIDWRIRCRCNERSPAS